MANRLRPVADQLQRTFALGDPFHDPIVEEFGLENAVFSVGDTFVEIVAPIRPGTAAGRHLERQGGDGGYMAIFQIPDLDAARRRIAQLGVRVVWQAEFADLVGMHLHPKDVPGAIVSLDWADPAGSWRWGGPAWSACEPAHPGGGITGLTLEVPDHASVAALWAELLDTTAAHNGMDASIRLASHRQELRFVPLRPGRPAGITEMTLSIPHTHPAGGDELIGGVRFVVTPVDSTEQR